MKLNARRHKLCPNCGEANPWYSEWQDEGSLAKWLPTNNPKKFLIYLLFYIAATVGLVILLVFNHNARQLSIVGIVLLALLGLLWVFGTLFDAIPQLRTVFSAAVGYLVFIASITVILVNTFKDINKGELTSDIATFVIFGLIGIGGLIHAIVHTMELVRRRKLERESEPPAEYTITSRLSQPPSSTDKVIWFWNQNKPLAISVVALLVVLGVGGLVATVIGLGIKDTNARKSAIGRLDVILTEEKEMVGKCDIKNGLYDEDNERLYDAAYVPLDRLDDQELSDHLVQMDSIEDSDLIDAINLLKSANDSLTQLSGDSERNGDLIDCDDDTNATTVLDEAKTAIDQAENAIIELKAKYL